VLHSPSRLRQQGSIPAFVTGRYVIRSMYELALRPSASGMGRRLYRAVCRRLCVVCGGEWGSGAQAYVHGMGRVQALVSPRGSGATLGIGLLTDCVPRHTPSIMGKCDSLPWSEAAATSHTRHYCSLIRNAAFPVVTLAFPLCRSPARRCLDDPTPSSQLDRQRGASRWISSAGRG
jgi:hypothetical protein